MQKIGVKTLSIIDTISELAQNETLSLAQLTPPNKNNDGDKSKSSKFLTSSPKKDSYSKEEDKGRRTQTPDWIKEIFDYVKQGNIEKLTKSLKGLESTLIRNITDHAGNNLLHCTCQYGHAKILPYLMKKLGSIDFNGALADVNRTKLSPPTIAVKYGRIECIKWLVRQSTNSMLTGGRIKEEQGGQQDIQKLSLLHSAAKYGQDEIVSWLSEEMTRNDMDLDQPDKYGNSPLHIASVTGNVSTISTLLNHGADVHLKNDIGMKSVDCARSNPRSRSAAEFLLLYESSLGISNEYLANSALNESLLAENKELKVHFKDILAISRKLMKERYELLKDYSRILESQENFQQKLPTLLSEVFDQQNFTRNNNNNIDIMRLSMNLLEKYNESKVQSESRQYFSGSQLAETDHKILKAEESWSKLNKNAHDSKPFTPDNRYSQRHLRDRIEELRNSLPSSSSMASLKEVFPEDSSTDDVSLPSSSRVTPLRQRKKMPTPTKFINGSLDESVYSSVSSSNEIYTKIASPVLKEDPKSRRKKSREDLRLKLKGHILSSENASVLEVIEPSSEEEEELKKTIANLSWAKQNTHQNSPEHSPTKRLLEMGIRASSLASPTNAEYLSGRVGSPTSKTNSLKKQTKIEEQNFHDKHDDKTQDEESSSIKPWYEVVSDEETEAPEADNLASIISHRDDSSDGEQVF